MKRSLFARLTRRVAGPMIGLMLAILPVSMIAQPATDAPHATILGYDKAHEITLNGTVEEVIAEPAAGSSVLGLNASSFSGNYALGVAEFFASGGNEFEVNGDGIATGTSGVLSGYLDQNPSLAGVALQPDGPIKGTYASTATKRVVTVTGSGSSLFTAYLIDATQGVIIENDNSQLLSGFFANQ
jgi:hypothetical protein